MTEDVILQWLPSRRGAVLRGAIGQRLVEIERLLTSPPADFARASGPVQLRFDGGALHTLAVLGSELSIIVLAEPLEPDYAAEVYALTQVRGADELRACIGRVCEDVRVWIYRDDVPSDEAREAAVSYVLSGGLELFYVIYLHGELDADMLALGDAVPRDHVARWFSVREAR